MNKPFLSCLFIVLCAGTAAHAQNTIKTGLSYAKFIRDGQSGIGYYSEYNHALNSVLSVAPSFQAAYGTKGQDFPYYLVNKFTAGLDINVFYQPLRFDKLIIRIGAGPSVRYFSGRNLSDFTIADRASIGGLGPSGEYSVPLFHPKARLKPTYVGIGYSGLIDSELNWSDHWVSSLRICYQSYTTSDRLASVGVSVGYRF